jgi:hypothetical protein
VNVKSKVKPVINHSIIPEEIIFEEKSYYLYQRRKNKWIKVCYEGIVYTNGKHKKRKHLFIEYDTGESVKISCDAVRDGDFQKTFE